MNTHITGAVIKRLREAKCITQTELAEQIGVSRKLESSQCPRRLVFEFH